MDMFACGVSVCLHCCALHDLCFLLLYLVLGLGLCCCGSGGVLILRYFYFVLRAGVYGCSWMGGGGLFVCWFRGCVGFCVFELLLDVGLGVGLVFVYF